MVLLSGGIDSAVCLYLAKDRYRTRALTFEYGGIARMELGAARAIAEGAGVSEHRLVRLPDIMEAAEIGVEKFPGLPATYIPMRNSIFYSIAAGYAEEVGADVIVGGHNRDDLKQFRDVSPQFFRELERTLWAGSKILSEKKTKIVRPLKEKTKPQVVNVAVQIGVPLGETWSCHRDGDEHCWTCEGCQARFDAFRKAGVPDPAQFTRATKVT